MAEYKVARKFCEVVICMIMMAKWMAISVLTLNKVCVAFCDCTLKNVTPIQGSNGVANLFFLWWSCEGFCDSLWTSRNPLIYLSFWFFGTSHYKITKFLYRIIKGCRGAKGHHESRAYKNLWKNGTVCKWCKRVCDKNKGGLHRSLKPAARLPIED